ncbi:hypothetical protein NQ314_009429 [Rhamnusium bicolor]|uniref:PiggyBac transposable element-derived protein domain-containing protein n=1 Tax=Rhamnusium bicolor TaxID=1586634 RepID=A0AAV8XZU2_9CUCU|nr:hypothetical protein NQ314_009429 [Rhamnusium bicolor]
MTDINDRLYKIRKPLEILNNTFQSVLTASRILVIDEFMIPFRVRIQFRQYTNNKSHKYGVKLYKICTVDGYISKVLVYTGKNEKVSGQGQSEKVVYELLKAVEHKEGHHLFADNFYSSLPLGRKFFEEKVVYCSTLRSNRRCIKEKGRCTVSRMIV